MIIYIKSRRLENIKTKLTETSHTCLVAQRGEPFQGSFPSIIFLQHLKLTVLSHQHLDGQGDQGSPSQPHPPPPPLPPSPSPSKQHLKFVTLSYINVSHKSINISCLKFKFFCSRSWNVEHSALSAHYMPATQKQVYACFEKKNGYCNSWKKPDASHGLNQNNIKVKNSTVCQGSQTFEIFPAKGVERWVFERLCGYLSSVFAINFKYSPFISFDLCCVFKTSN